MDSPVISVAEMRAAEEAAFARGVSAEALMDEAGAGIARAVAKFFPQAGRCIVFAGKGNNAGDAFVAAEWLARDGWAIDVRFAFAEADLGELARKQLGRLGGVSKRADVGLRNSPTVILDGLLGLGATPPLREPISSACREINRLRGEQDAYVFAIDLPTGLDGDSREADADCVVADFTVTIGFTKRGLVVDRALNFVGRLEVIALDDLRRPNEQGADHIASADSLRHLLPRRNFGAYKNQFGRVGIVAGSRGFTGAAIMCSLGALRAGAGLVELFVPEEIYPIIAAAAPPEAMVKPVKSYAQLADEPLDVFAIGPGLGKSRSSELIELIEQAKQSAVLDADALNIISSDVGTLDRASGPRLITPHPGEMARLCPVEGRTRSETAMNFCRQHAVTLLLKGSRTIVAERDRPLSYNTTGNPGMATGGMGDVLTGVCAALIAQRLSPYDAGRLGAWVCGRAAEIAVFNGGASEESLLPRDVIEHLGSAFDDLRSGNGAR